MRVHVCGPVLRADLGLNFRTGYFDDSHQLVMEPRLIAKRYTRGWFSIDLLSVRHAQTCMAAAVATMPAWRCRSRAAHCHRHFLFQNKTRSFEC